MTKENMRSGLARRRAVSANVDTARPPSDSYSRVAAFAYSRMGCLLRERCIPFCNVALLLRGVKNRKRFAVAARETPTRPSYLLHLQSR